ncbi:YceD family protein [Bacillus sp. JCM 19034]|uniref:YceD family protein n=1 Tax=Bacillus sp. JCM 19034 TaxID=1481928 RepID=UPI000B134214|nr:YceD family protein [Bacillus sp. JCM 19034]
MKPVIEEAVLLEIPIQVFAENVSKPIAPPEGKHWELVTEEKKENRIDPRLADLAKFFEKE